MDFKLQRKLAARILKCGTNRVRFILPEDVPDDVIERIENAITRSDVRNLLTRYHPIDKGGVVGKRQAKGVSRGRARYLRGQKRSGRRRGPGSRRGPDNARTPKKARWMRDIRSVRSTLKELRDSGAIPRPVYREYYRRAKGGAIRSRARVIAMLMAAGHLKEAPKPKSPPPAKAAAAKPAPKPVAPDGKEKPKEEKGKGGEK
jgi:large subunit ribosomal protein L19e